MRKLLLKDYIYYLLILIIVIFSFFRIYVFGKSSVYKGHETSFTGKLQEFEFDGNKLKITIIAEEKLLGTYYIDKLEDKNKLEKELKLGDTIKINGNLKKPNNNTVPNLFNYKKYLYNNKIYWTINIESVIKISDNKNIFYGIKNFFISRINNFKYSSNYLLTFILGDSSKIDDKVNESYQNNGISHLFAVSGMHVSLFMTLIIFILKKLEFKESVITIFSIIFLLFYMFLTSFTASILRAGIFFILITINKTFNLKIKTINLMWLLLTIILLIDPFLIFNLGFQFSYTISLFLILFSNIISRQKNYFTKVLTVSFISFLVSLPITIYNFYQINVFSILLNLIFVPLISYVVFPLSLITFIFPFLDKLLSIFIFVMEELSLLFSNVKIFSIILSKPPILIILLYYLVIIFILIMINKRKYKYLLLLVLLIFIHSNIIYLNNKLYIVMIDVGQGDSLLIVFPNNKGNILIDTGGRLTFEQEEWEITNSNYSISNDTLIPLFKSLGIKRLDYLILTHGDIDHIGESMDLVENIKINKVIFNNGEFSSLEQKLVELLDKKGIKYYKGIDNLKINNNKLYFLNTIEYDNENDNSNVLYFNYNDIEFLFTGDAGIEVEENILKNYNINNIDILKVGHHGSDTSSSKSFINIINPKYSLISVGKNNRYGHPNREVLNNLKETKIYRTDKDGSVIFKVYKNKLNIKIYKP